MSKTWMLIGGLVFSLLVAQVFQGLRDLNAKIECEKKFPQHEKCVHVWMPTPKEPTQ